MSEKRINVTRSSLPPMAEYIEEIKDIWDTHWLTNMGEKHNRLEQQLCKKLMVGNVSLFNNGHLALELCIQAFGLKGEVITTPFTFASTTHAIVRNGLIPVFCDINEDDCTIDTQKLESLITEKTCAIVPVHVYGNICDNDEIMRIAKKHHLKVIYDAAHAFGVEISGKSVAAYGDASMFSFHATKVFHTIEGGAVTCDSESLYRSLYNLKNFGILDAEHVVAVGGNSKMNEFQAAMGLCNLRRFDEDIASRKAVVARYCERLSDTQGLSIKLLPKENLKMNYAYFPVCFDETVFGAGRDEVYDTLCRHNIVPRKYFYPLVNDFDCYKDQYDSALTPVAKRIASCVLTLPLYAGLELCDVDYICDIILSMKK